FKAFPETKWAQGQERRTEFCSYLLRAEPQPAPAFRELTDKVEGRASRAPGGFPGRVSGATGLGVRLTLLKANKAGQRMGPPDRAAGVWEGGTRQSRGGLWLQQLKGQEMEGRGRGLPCRILHLQGSHRFYGRLHPSEINRFFFFNHTSVELQTHTNLFFFWTLKWPRPATLATSSSLAFIIQRPRALTTLGRLDCNPGQHP
ncbi:hypothetical protein E2I00_000750, partial [Balaenoptera physalus]